MQWPPPGADWKLWSADRFAEYWGAFVELPAARLDPQFDVILVRACFAWWLC